MLRLSLHTAAQHEHKASGMTEEVYTMADSGPPNARQVSRSVDVSVSHHTEWNDTMETAPAKEALLQYDTFEDGGLVAMCVDHHATLFSLLNSLDKDVYYSIDSSAFHHKGGPSLILSLKHKFPSVDCASVLSVFKRCNVAGKFNKHAHFFVTREKYQQTKWFMNRSASFVDPCKTPNDQLKAFESGLKCFWLYEDTKKATPYVFKRDMDEQTTLEMLESLKVRRIRDDCVEYDCFERVTKEQTAEGTRVLDRAGNQYWGRCFGFTAEFIKANNLLLDPDKVLKGFYHLVGEGLHNQASIVSNQGDWPYDPPICGFLQSKTGKSPIVNYTVSQLPGRIFAINSIKCKGNSSSKKLPCEECKSVAGIFYRRCRYVVDNLEGEFKSKINVSKVTSLELAKRKFESDRKEKQALRQKIARLSEKTSL